MHYVLSCRRAAAAYLKAIWILLRLDFNKNVLSARLMPLKMCPCRLARRRRLPERCFDCSEVGFQWGNHMHLDLEIVCQVVAADDGVLAGWRATASCLKAIWMFLRLNCSETQTCSWTSKPSAMSRHYVLSCRCAAADYLEAI